MGFWKNILPATLYKPLNELRRNYLGESITTYSGEGEDLILRKIFTHQLKGFYVDIGAYHPKVYSNTYYFSKKGWSGINIDANPKTIDLFKKFRPYDINLNIGVSQSSGLLNFYQFEESAINTFSEELYQERLTQKNVNFIGKTEIQTLTLSEILDKYLPQNQVIDFLDIDAEGLDMEVLKSNNWEKYQPKVILVEDASSNVNSVEDLETFKFLNPLGYKLLAKTVSTMIFVR